MSSVKNMWNALNRLTLEHCDIPNSGQTWSLDIDAVEAVNFDPWGREVTDQIDRVLSHVPAVHVVNILEKLLVIIDSVVPLWLHDQNLVRTPRLVGRHQPGGTGHAPLLLPHLDRLYEINTKIITCKYTRKGSLNLIISSLWDLKVVM